MTTYEFEVAAKNVVIKVAKNNLSKDITIDQIDVVWMAHVLGNKKCVLRSKYLDCYFEVTYDREEDVMYLDMYEKVFHTYMTEFDTHVHK